MAARIDPLGDSALLLTLGDSIDPLVNEQVHRLAAAVRWLRRTDPRYGAPTPAYASLLVPFDPVALPLDEALRVMETLAADPEPGAGAGPGLALGRAADARPAGAAAAPGDDVPGSGEHPADPGEAVEIPVRYGGAGGPDLEAVAARAGLSPDEVVQIHAGTEYRCYMLGFMPGFAYLGPLDPRIATPRLATPRSLVPAGSVGIAGRQTGVYPVDSPGGWQLIGRTEVRTWDPGRDPPARLRPGATVRFVAVR